MTYIGEGVTVVLRKDEQSAEPERVVADVGQNVMLRLIFSLGFQTHR